jgi:subtilisin family serine protease
MLRQLLALVIAAGVLVLSWSGLIPAQLPSRADPSIARQLQTDGQAQVIVTLYDPVPLGASLSWRKQLVSAEVESVLRQLSAQDFQLRRRFETIAAFAGVLSSSGLAKLEHHPKVRRIEPDITLYALTPQPKLQPQLNESVPLIQANSVHNLGIRGDGVRIAIIDTGIDTDHPDFSTVTPGDRIVAQNCFLFGASCPSAPNVAEDGNGHGTHVAGIAASDGSVAPVGVAPHAQLVVIKVLRDNGSGYLSDTVAALDWIYNNNASLNVKVVNMSLGSSILYTPPCDDAYPGMTTAINNLRNIGVISFAASGNDANATQMSLPACISNTVSVGAVYDANVGGISWGSPVVCTDSTTAPDKVACITNGVPDLQAPGALITSSVNGGGTATYGGTSMASPHAAGTAALLLQAKPSLTPTEIETVLQTTGVLVIDSKNGQARPRINALAAVNAVINTPAIFRIERTTGNAYADGSWNAGGADVAEYIAVSEPVEPGDVVELDPHNPKYYRKARSAYSPLVAGVISTQPGVVLGARTQSEGRALLALVGRVPVKATTENGPIRPGDLLTSASKPGYAMRCESAAQCEGAIIGKALEALNEGEGFILMLVMR